MPYPQSAEPALRPWHRYYGKVPRSLDYPVGSLSSVLLATARKQPDLPATTFLGETATYGELTRDIERFAGALQQLGLGAGDRFLVAMPTSPQGVIGFYAANLVGAVAVMVHPLCPAAEIEEYVRASRARAALTLELLYPAFAGARKRGLEHLILTRLTDTLSWPKRVGYRLTRGRSAPAIPRDLGAHWWRDLMSAANTPSPHEGGGDDLAAIFFSGGTTGSPKGVMLSNRNIIAEGAQAAAWVGLGPRDSMLAALPIFHGVGLGLCVNAVLRSGGRSILVPQFNPETIVRVIRKERPTLMVGVPTLFDSLSRSGEGGAGTDFSSLRGAFCGADRLPRPVKERFEAMVEAQGGRVRLLEGYGLTEAVSGIMAMPLDTYREDSVGIPFPDMDAEIFRPGTSEPVPPGTEGEICLSGPAVMLGYLDDPAGTEAALHRHPDGKVWLHTGDLGSRDEDGFFRFVLRVKRIIKSSGFNVFPSQVEEVLDRHPAVVEACVIGLPDPSQGERVVACVVVRDGVNAGPELEQELIRFCREHLIKWSCPREVHFRPALPKTRLGKVDYRGVMETVRGD